MGEKVSKEVDQWLSQMTALLKEREVKEEPILMLRRVVETVLDGIGKEKLQGMETTDILVAVRDGIPKVPTNMLRADYVAKNSELVTKAIEQYFTKNKITSGGELKTFGDGVVNELEVRIAKYISELPKDLTIKRDGLTLVVSKKGAAAKISGDGFDLSADVQGKQNKLKLETKDLVLDLTQKGAALSADAQLKVVKGSLDLLVELHAREGKLDPNDKSEEARALRAKIDATYKDLKVQVDASLEKLEAKIEYLKKDPGLKQVLLQVQSDYEKLEAKFKLVYAKKDTKILVDAIATAEKLEAKVIAETKTAGGVDVKAQLDATLERLQAKIEVFKSAKDHKVSFVAGLETNYKDLKAQAALVYKASDKKKQLELIAKFEATLEKVKAEIELSLKTGSWSVSVSGAVDSEGTASGKVAAMVQLGKGINVMGGNTYLSAQFGMNDKGWTGFVGLSLTSPPRAADVARVFRNAESNFNNAYGVLNDPKYSGASADAIMGEVQTKLQALPPAIKLDVGFQAGGSFPNAPLPTIPTFGGLGLKVSWF